MNSTINIRLKDLGLNPFDRYNPYNYQVSSAVIGPKKSKTSTITSESGCSAYFFCSAYIRIIYSMCNWPDPSDRSKNTGWSDHTDSKPLMAGYSQSLNYRRDCHVFI